MTADTAADHAALPGAGPFAPVKGATGNGGEMRRAVLTSILALYPVLAAVAVVIVSLSMSGA
jgi:hypothetical protein